MKTSLAFILALLLTSIIAINFYFIKEEKNTKTLIVERVIDGDTFESDGQSYRLANINTPEKNERGYEEAKAFLSKFEGESIEVELLGEDKYNRLLVRAYSPDYLNLEIISKGLGKKFLVQEDELKEFDKAESQAIEKQKGNWEHSESYGCFTSKINQEDEIIALINTCPELDLMDFIITDESRKKYKFTSIRFSAINLHSKSGSDNSSDLHWQSVQSIWNNDRDTLYILDSQEKIAHFHSYGYSIFVFSPKLLSN